MSTRTSTNDGATAANNAHTEPLAIARFADLDGRLALVTGASAGIGRAIRDALLDQGCRVVGIDRADDVSEGAYEHVACDLADDRALACQLSRFRESQATLDYVVNCAGIDPFVALEQADAAAWSRVLDLDLRAYHLVLHHTVGALKRGVGKSVVNIGSINFRLGVPARALYTTAKNAIIGLTRGLARELGADGIRVNTVSPGWVFTERQERDYFDGPDRDKHLATLARAQALSLHIAPADIASHTLFYLSRSSRASTGHNCVVDAGWLLE